MRVIGQGLSDHHVVLCKFKLVGAWIKRREVVNGARRIRIEKIKCLEGIELSKCRIR